jgi:DNA-binding LacI/PurR family transcriptional regulator
VDGFIIHRFEEASILEARRRKLPSVIVDMDGDHDTSSIRINDRAGARQAAQHLVDLGHRKFAIFSVLRDAGAGSGPVVHEPGPSRQQRKLSANFALDRDRIAGYRGVLGKAGIKFGDVPIVETWADVPEASRDGAAALFDRWPEVTAVLATTDVQALGIMDEARRRGIRIPQDLSIVGFDDIPESAGSQPPLTTVIHPIVEKGRLAARLVFDDKPGTHVVLPVSLNVRQSTARPPVQRKRASSRNSATGSARRS